jgi:hypothetical protein
VAFGGSEDERRCPGDGIFSELALILGKCTMTSMRLSMSTNWNDLTGISEFEKLSIPLVWIE